MTLMRPRAGGRARQYSVILRRKLPENLTTHNAAGANAIMSYSTPAYGANLESQSRASTEALVQQPEAAREVLEHREILKQMQLRLNQIAT